MSDRDKKRDTITERKRLDALENAVENHTRTERHLANYGFLVDDEEYETTMEKQSNREENIRNTENAILRNQH